VASREQFLFENLRGVVDYRDYMASSASRKVGAVLKALMELFHVG